MDSSKELQRLEKLLSFQRTDGSFCGRNFGASTDICEFLLLKIYLNKGIDQEDMRLVKGLRGFQRSDGGITLHYGISQGIEDASYMALLTLEELEKRACLSGQDLICLEKLRAFVEELGTLGFGPYQTKNIVRLWLCLFSRISFSSFPPIMRELFALLNPSREAALVSPWMEYASWIMAHAIREAKLQSPLSTYDPMRCSYELIETALHKVLRPVLNRMDARAKEKVHEFLCLRQGPSGSYFGVSLISIYAALALSHYPGEEGRIDRVFQFLKSIQGPAPCEPAQDESIQGPGKTSDDSIQGHGEPSVGWIQDPFEGPVWDSAHVLLSFSPGQTQKAESEVQHCVEYLLSRQLSNGGWGYQGSGDEMADFDDTAQVIRAFQYVLNFNWKVGLSEQLVRSIQNGRDFLARNQSPNGGFAAWRPMAGWHDGSSLNVPEWGFFRHAFATDFQCVDVTANVCMVLPEESQERGIRYLQGAQDPDGSFWGRWGVNRLYASSKVLTLLASLKTEKSFMLNRALSYLLAQQNSDGGFSEDNSSYFCDRTSGTGEKFGRKDSKSSVLQSCWVLEGLLLHRSKLQELVLERAFSFLSEFEFDSLKPEYLGVSMPPLNYAPELHSFLQWNKVMNMSLQIK